MFNNGLKIISQNSMAEVGNNRTDVNDYLFLSRHWQFSASTFKFITQICSDAKFRDIMGYVFRPVDIQLLRKSTDGLYTLNKNTLTQFLFFFDFSSYKTQKSCKVSIKKVGPLFCSTF